jgi:hypothetical protein
MNSFENLGDVNEGHVDEKKPKRTPEHLAVPPREVGDSPLVTLD